MAKKTIQFVLKDEYEKWLLDNRVKSTAAYCPQDEYECNGNYYLFLDIIGRFAKEKERFYVDALFQEWKSFIEKTFKDKERSNHLSYLNKYQIFVDNIFNGTISLSTPDPNDNYDKVLTSVRKSINKSRDGMKSLEMYLGEEDFIKLAIESSYFFSPDLVKKRFDEIKDYICKEQTKDIKDPGVGKGCKVHYLPARYTAKEDANGVKIQKRDNDGLVFFMHNSQPLCIIYQENARKKDKEDCSENTCGGGNGNTRVCQLIKRCTGYALGKKADERDFKNCIISHIWGNAIDPRYFTNLWNIAIVPAWANHLLDKDETGTLGSKLKATIQKIITVLYTFDSYDWESIKYDWESIKMDVPTCNEEEVLHGNYHINTIDGIADKETLGRLSRVSIPV